MDGRCGVGQPCGDGAGKDGEGDESLGRRVESIGAMLQDPRIPEDEKRQLRSAQAEYTEAAGRARRHGIGADAVTVESGVVAWRSAVVPLDRVQSWSVTQSPFQRRHGLHHVSIHVSGVRTVRVLDVSAAQSAALVSALRRSVG